MDLEVRVREKDRCLMEGLKVILERFGGISGEWGSMGWKTGWWSSIWESRWGCVGKEGWAVGYYVKGRSCRHPCWGES